jgi:hypothetical protein
VVDLDNGANGMVTLAISGSAESFLTIDSKVLLFSITVIIISCLENIIGCET